MAILIILIVMLIWVFYPEFFTIKVKVNSETESRMTKLMEQIEKDKREYEDNLEELRKRSSEPCKKIERN